MKSYLYIEGLADSREAWGEVCWGIQEYVRTVGTNKLTVEHNGRTSTMDADATALIRLINLYPFTRVDATQQGDQLVLVITCGRSREVLILRGAKP